MSLQIRRGTDSQRQAVVFDLGEIVYTTDTKKLYVGDGATAGGINILASSAGSGLTWNNTTQTFNQGGSLSGYTTDNLSQGTVNLYYSSTRAKADAASIFTANGSPTVTGTVTTTTSGTPSLVTVSSNTGLVALEPFVVTGSGGNGLSAGTYYVVNPAAGTNQITLASSLANAAAGTTINSLTTGAISGTSFTAGGAPDSNITFVYNSATGTMTANVSSLAAGIQNVNADTSPTLGGNLGLNYHNITGNGNINITGYITASGAITGGSVSTAGTLTAGSVSTGGNVTASGTISGGTIASSGTISASGNITASGTITGTSYSGGTINGTTLTLSSGLGGNLVLNSYSITGTGGISMTGPFSVGNIASNVKLAFSSLQNNGLDVSLPTNGLLAGAGTVAINAARGTNASPTTTQAGDILGGWAIRGYNGTSYLPGILIGANWDSTANLTTAFPASKFGVFVGSNGSSPVAFSFNYQGILNAPVTQTTVYSAAGTAIPSASSVGIGARAFVSDATAITWGTAYTSGGSNKVPVWSNGTSWYIG